MRVLHLYHELYHTIHTKQSHTEVRPYLVKGQDWI